MGIKKRAISKEEKQARKNHIQKMALKLFQTKSFNEINIDSIAKEAKVAKGTVFFYFDTKEDLFLSIAKKKIKELFTNINKSLLELVDKAPSKKDLSDILLGYLRENSILTRLIAILNTTLEKNISYEKTFEFKKMIHDNLFEIGLLIEKCLPSLTPGSGVKIMLWSYVLIIGIQHMTDPSRIAKEVIERENLEGFNLKFEELFDEMINLIFKGMDS